MRQFRFWWLVLVTLLCTISAAAFTGGLWGGCAALVNPDTGSPGATDTGSATATIEGGICDVREKGTPIADAYVFVAPRGSRAAGLDVSARQDDLPSTRTDANGAYTLTGLPPGTYVVTIQPPEGSEFAQAQFEVTIGEDGSTEEIHHFRLGTPESEAACHNEGEDVFVLQ